MDNQYFSNKEYFKRKVNEDDPFSLSEKLFMKHQRVQEAKDENILHNPFPEVAYYVRKEDL